MVDITQCGCVAGYLFRKWGGRLAELAENPTVGTAAAELVGGDPERVALSVINLSAAIVYLAPRTDVSATNGIRLAANGGSMTLSVDDDGVLLSAPWHAIATAADSQVYVLQVRRVTATEMEQSANAA